MNPKDKVEKVSDMIYKDINKSANDSRVPITYREECLLKADHEMWKAEYIKALKAQAEEIFKELEKIGNVVDKQCELCDETYEDCDCYDKLKERYLKSND